MGVRDRIASLGRRAASTALMRVEATADRFLPPDTDHPVPSPDAADRIEKAEEGHLPELGADEDPKSLFHDPYALIEQLGFREKPTAVTYGTLKAITWKVPVITAILQTRLNQMSAFAKPQEDEYSMGFKIQLRDRKAKLSRVAEKEAENIKNAVLTTGFTQNPKGRDNFESFMRKTMWDSLSYDQWNCEVVPNRKGTPAEWYAVDASTIRLADTPKFFNDEDDTKAIRSVQIYDNTIIAEYTQDEMAFCTRNPRTDIRSFGYGVSELEMLISTVTSLLWAWAYNQNAFAQGSLQKGLLNLKGTINQRQFRAFRRHWYQLLAGVENAWRTPILNANEGIEWVPMQNTNRDMEYNAWMDFLIKVACGMYSMDPVEIQFQYGTSQKSRPMFEGNNKARLVESRDRGLKPLLRFFGDCMNTNIIHSINEDFELYFAGLNAPTPDEQVKLDKERVSTTFTVNEIRAERDDKPLEFGDVILNPVYQAAMQMAQQKEMMDQQQAAGELGPGEENGAEGPTGAGGPEGASDADKDTFLQAFSDLEDDEEKSIQDIDDLRKAIGDEATEAILLEVSL